MRGALNLLAANWPYDVIVLVWQAIPELLRSGLLKDHFNCRSQRDLSMLIEHPTETIIVVFDMYTPTVTASMTNMFGGYPTLVYDVSGLRDMSLLRQLHKPNRTIYTFNLPFYMDRCIPSTDTRGLYPLLEGSKRVQLHDKDQALASLHAATNKLDWNTICCGCFQNRQGLGMAVHDDHMFCGSCSLDDDARCYHHSHQTAVAAAVAAADLFMTDADLLLFEDWVTQ